MELLTAMNRASLTGRLRLFTLLRRLQLLLRLLQFILLFPVVLLHLRFQLAQLLPRHPPRPAVVQLELRHRVSLTRKRRCCSARTTSSSELLINTYRRPFPRAFLYTSRASRPAITVTHTHTHTQNTLLHDPIVITIFILFSVGGNGCVISP